MANNFPVLLVEDNKIDVMMVKRVWKINKITNPLFVVSSCNECLDYLRNQGKYKDREEFPRPGIILMDIQMTGMDGIECLKIIKQDPNLKIIPVIMLTLSQDEKNIIRSYQFGCNTFIQKSLDFDKFAETVRQILLYWNLSELA